jgi:hypothetical protein
MTPSRPRWSTGSATARLTWVLGRIPFDAGEAFEGSARYLDAAQLPGLPPMAASASRCDVLVAAGVGYLVEVDVDGRVAAAKELDVTPDWAAGFEVVLVGVASGRAGFLGCGAGVEGVAQADAVRSLGVDVVVADLAAVP